MMEPIQIDHFSVQMLRQEITLAIQDGLQQSEQNLRDHFAGLAMQSFLSQAAGSWDEAARIELCRGFYHWADSMLKAREGNSATDEQAQPPDAETKQGE